MSSNRPFVQGNERTRNGVEYGNFITKSGKVELKSGNTTVNKKGTNLQYISSSSFSHKAKEAERHTKLRLNKKNELVKLRCLRQFLCDNHKPILAEFECGYDKEKNEYVSRQQTTSNSSQTEADNNIFDEITTDDLSWLPQPEDMGDLFTRLVNGE